VSDSPENGFAGSSYSNEPTEATYRFPWPPAEDAPVVGGLVDTWRDAVFRPVRFFRALPIDLSLGATLLYYLVIGILAAALQLFWATLLPAPDGDALGDLIGTAAAASPLVDFLMSPLLLMVSLYVAAGVTHVMVLVLMPGNAGFGGTLRSYGFAYSPALFNAIPYVGPIAAFLWMTALSVIGIREVHRSTTGRAVTAVLIPLLIAGMFVLLSYLLLRSGALLTLAGER
jgi:hypothetical protein